MDNVLALIPARANSKGIPGKNLKPLAGQLPLLRALNVCEALGVTTVLTTDYEAANTLEENRPWLYTVRRPPELATDEAAMIDVVKHALAEIPGPEDQIVLLLQPTQPLRQPKHLTAAIELLHTSGADSVVSVVEVPLTHSPDLVCVIEKAWHGGPEELMPYPVSEGYGEERIYFRDQPSRRQDAQRVYQRDGTVYAFRRKTLKRDDGLYGRKCVPLIIDPSETTPLDTPADWARAEELLRAR